MTVPVLCLAFIFTMGVCGDVLAEGKGEKADLQLADNVNMFGEPLPLG